MVAMSRFLLSQSSKTTVRSLQSCMRARRRRGALFSSTTTATPRSKNKICIHFATSTGTAQLFAHDLQNALLQENDLADDDVQVQDLGATRSVDQLDPAALHLFLVSTTGVGQFPGSAEAFVSSLQAPSEDEAAGTNTTAPPYNIHFGIFGLGNSAAHPNHYNVASKTLYDKLVATTVAQPWMPLALGDDGDCIEDDFDMWQAAVLQKLRHSEGQNEPVTTETTSSEDVAEESSVGEPSSDAATAVETTTVAAPVVPAAFGKRLELVPAAPSANETTRTDLWDALPAFYHANAQRWRVVRQTTLSPQPTANALHELQLELWASSTDGDADLQYSAGDHLVVYPSHSDFLVEAYLDHFDIDVETAMHSTLEQTPAVEGLCEASAYPHFTGVSLYDTMRYLVDLQAPPSPRLARSLMGRDDIDYKEQVFIPRQSPLALLKQSGRKDVALEDLLYQLPAMTPRYYSIASSPMVHPHTIYLTYRPVRFLTSLGNPQEGVCTSYLSKLEQGSTVMAYVNHNPSFRLPDDPTVPIILLAGGCGVAAVRSLVEELQARGNSNPTYVFLGFRNPADAAYLDLMESIEPELLDVSYSVSCTRTEARCALVSDRVQEHGSLVYDLLEHQGGYVYLCGGARTFGAAIQRELYNIYETIGQHSPEEGRAALQALLEQGRYCEDLAD